MYICVSVSMSQSEQSFIQTLSHIQQLLTSTCLKNIYYKSKFFRFLHLGCQRYRVNARQFIVMINAIKFSMQ